MNNFTENHNQSSLFKWIRKHTFYNAFKKALTDNKKLSDYDESLLKALHLMLVTGIFLLLSALSINLLINVPKESNDLGTFGDFIGGLLNPIFTLMTFFGVIVTIALQKLELRAAREEYTKSADALSTQAIENMFFNMLELHHKIVDGLKFSLGHTPNHENLNWLLEPDAKKYSFFQDKTIYHGVETFSRLLEIMKPYKTKDDTLSLYKLIQEEYNHVFGHYFRNLYQILKFIHTNNNITSNKKKEYASMLRAQLSTDELAVLFINCTGEMVDDGGFRKLLIQYQMLEHMKLELCLYGYKNKDDCYITSKDVVIADETSINEFRSKINNGAFGKNSAQFPPLEA